MALTVVIMAVVCSDLDRLAVGGWYEDGWVGDSSNDIEEPMRKKVEEKRGGG